MKPGICFAQEIVETNSLSINSDKKEIPRQEEEVTDEEAGEGEDEEDVGSNEEGDVTGVTGMPDEFEL